MKILSLNSILLLLLFVIIAGCYDNDGYTTDVTGLRYKILQQSESKIQIKAGDIVELIMKYTDSQDSILFNSAELGRPFRIEVGKKSHGGGCFEEALMLLHPGDRALFKIPADSFYLKTMRKKIPNGLKNSKLIFDINLLKILDKKEIEEERKLMAESMKEQEENLIKGYLSDNNISIEPKLSGLYYIETKKGIGKKVKMGDKLKVRYTGSFIDGKIFDSSYQRKEDFTFRMGKGDVIAGWEEGFSLMQEGGKAKFIIPSNLAYGEKGVERIIPPYSTLIFEVELVKIN
ncbi:MAG: FKBP-type peptidyl-prolyl cis-trans isomerase [Bacteroidales bacterium]